MEGGAGSEAGKSNNSPSGKIPEAADIRNSPAARASRLIWRVRKPQGLPVRDSMRNSRELSMKRSWAWRCCGLRKVPFIQITGWSRFIGYQVSRTAREWQRWGVPVPFPWFSPDLACWTPLTVAGILKLVLRGGFGRIGVVRAGRLNASKMGNGERGGL